MKSGNVTTGRLLGAQLREMVFTAKRPAELIYSFVRSGASIEMAVNGLVTPVLFKYTVPAGFQARISRLVVHLTDAGSNPGDFGGINGGVANGVLFQVFDSDDVLMLDFLDGTAIQVNGDYAHMSGVDIDVKVGVGLDSTTARATMTKTGASLLLVPGEYIGLTVRDDLTSISGIYRVMVHGTLDPLV